MILGFDAAWLEINKGFTKELAGWIRDTLADHSDVYFVTQIQVILFIIFETLIFMIIIRFPNDFLIILVIFYNLSNDLCVHLHYAIHNRLQH